MTGGTEWTEAETMRLRELRDLGYSATEIGNSLGRTRCMVLGKIFRLGLRGCGKTKGERIAVSKKRDLEIAALYNDGHKTNDIAQLVGVHVTTVERALIRTGTREKRVPGSSFDSYRTDGRQFRRSSFIDFPVSYEPAGPLVAFLDLEPQHCRWPHGNPGEDGFGFCGAQRINATNQYCAMHMRIAYRKPPIITDDVRNRRRIQGYHQIATGTLPYWDFYKRRM